MGGLFVYNNDTIPVDDLEPGIIITGSTGTWYRINFTFINVKWYGVKSTNSDNSEAISKALEYASKVGKEVLFPYFKDPLICIKEVKVPNNVSLIGNNTTIHCASPAIRLFNIDGSQDVKFKGFIFDGKSAAIDNNKKYDSALIYIQNSLDVKVVECVVQNAGLNTSTDDIPGRRCGIYINKSKYCTVINNTIKNNEIGVLIQAVDSDEKPEETLHATSYNIISQNIINGSTGDGIRENSINNNVGYNCIIGNVGGDRINTTADDSIVTLTLGDIATSEKY